jgi:hypothetical protein
MKAHENPFASHIISTIEYRFERPHDLDLILRRFEENHRRGAIVGPHGSGKTTLLRTIRTELQRKGFEVCSVELRDKEPKQIELPPKSVVIIDGAEQISALKWWLLMRRAERAQIRGVIITTHRPQKLPTIYQTRPSQQVFTQLVAELCSADIASNDLAAVYAKHDGNVREALREMYDRMSF